LQAEKSILNNPSWTSQLAKIAENAARVGDYSIGIPVIQDVLRNMKLTPQEIARYQYGAMLFAQSQLEASQLAKGQGQVSDFERRLFAATAMTSEDTPATLQMKAKALIARGQVERQIARLWEESKGRYRSVSEFKRSDEYDRLVAEYDAKLAKLLETMPVPSMPGTPGKPRQQPKFKFD
jgi:capsule polysaccharide export protein KpsE/RkpR